MPSGVACEARLPQARPFAVRRPVEREVRRGAIARMVDGMKSDEIPPLLPPDKMPRITNQATLERTWRALMGKLGFSEPQLWIMFLIDGHAAHLMDVRELPEHPDQRFFRNLRQVVREMVDETECAFLYCRPGPRFATESDQAWASGLSGLLARGWPVHLANDQELRVVAPDDLVA
jgi:hypothetical protein